MNDSPGAGHWLEIALRRHEEQSRRNRRAHQGDGRRDAQYNHMVHRRGIRVIQRRPGALRPGLHEAADLVEIRWPSGIVQELKNLPADRIVKVKEPRP